MRARRRPPEAQQVLVRWDARRSRVRACQSVEKKKEERREISGRFLIGSSCSSSRAWTQSKFKNQEDLAQAQESALVRMRTSEINY